LHFILHGELRSDFLFIAESIYANTCPHLTFIV